MSNIYLIPQVLIDFIHTDRTDSPQAPKSIDVEMSAKLFEAIDTGQHVLNRQTDKELVAWIEQYVASKQENYILALLHARFVQDRATD